MSSTEKLPPEWFWATIGELCGKPQYGWTTSANGEGDGPKLLRTTDITRGPVDWKSVPACREAPPDLEKYLLRPGDILISRAGSVGFSTLIEDCPAAVFASYLIRFRPTSNVNPRYLLYFLQSPSYWRAISEKAAGIALANVNATKLAAIRVPIAPRDQQDRIVAEIEKQFTRLDAGVADLRRASSRLRYLRPALFAAATAGRLAAPTTDSTRNEWVDVEIASVATAVDYGTSVKTSVAGDVPVLRMGNIVNGKLDLHNLKFLPANHEEFPNLLLRDGDLLFNRTNSAELVGKCAVYHSSAAPCSFASYLIRVRFNDRANPDYVSYCINSPAGRKWIASVVSQQVGQANVNGSKLKAFTFPLPPDNTQERIVAEVERRLEILTVAEVETSQQLQKAAHLRRSILQRAFSGRLVTTERVGASHDGIGRIASANA